MPAYRSALLFGLVFTFCQWLIIAGLLLAVVFSFGYGENDYASMNVEFSIVLYLGFSQIYEKLPFAPIFGSERQNILLIKTLVIP